MTDYLSQKIKIVSFIAIFFVLLQHAINFTGYIDPNSSFFGKATWNTIFQYVVGYGVSRIAVALFFLLSGYLFFRNFTLSRYFFKIRSRTHSLFVPYVVWSALGLGFIFILQSFPELTNYFSSLYTGRVIGQPFSYYVQSILHHGVTFPLWFLADLILYTLLAPLFYIVLKFTSVGLVVPLFILWIFSIPLPPVFSFLYRGGFFYLLGAYVAISRVYLPSENAKQMGIFAFLCWIILIVSKTCVAFGIFPSLWLTLRQLDNMTIAVGICALWFGYDMIAKLRCLSTISLLTPFTFFIFVSHEPLLELVKRIGVDFVGRSENALFILYCGSIVVTLCITIGLGFLLRRFTSKLFVFLVGGR